MQCHMQVDHIQEADLDEDVYCSALNFSSNTMCVCLLAQAILPPSEILEGWLAGKEMRWPKPPMDVNLRFKIGTRIECCVGRAEWLAGTIVSLWYSEPGFPSSFLAPYQVKLEDGRLIFAPEDSNRCIREEV